MLGSTVEDVNDTQLLSPYTTLTCPAGIILTDILFSNISATQTGGLAGELYCSDTVPCTDITMKNINIKLAGQGKQRNDDGNMFKCWRAFGKADNVEPPSCLMTI